MSSGENGALEPVNVTVGLPVSHLVPNAAASAVATGLPMNGDTKLNWFMTFVNLPICCSDKPRRNQTKVVQSTLSACFDAPNAAAGLGIAGFAAIDEHSPHALSRRLPGSCRYFHSRRRLVYARDCRTSGLPAGFIVPHFDGLVGIVGREDLTAFTVWPRAACT